MGRADSDYGQANDATFTIELDTAITALDLEDLERQLEQVLAGGSDRMLPRSLVELKNKAAVIAAYSGSLTDHELELALMMLTARLQIGGYLSRAPDISDLIGHRE